MRRYLFMLICALGLAVVPQAPALAQAAPDLCTATVYVEPGLGLSAENADLRQATNLLSERGIDARILLLQDLDGASEVKEYERTTLARECPDLIQQVDGRLVRKRDLFMVVLAIPMREKGAVFGDNPAGRAHNEDVFSDVANPYLREGSENNDPAQFAIGVREYFEELSERMGNPPGEEPAQTRPSEPSEPFNWTPVFVVAGITFGLMALAVLIYVIRNLVRNAREQRRRKADLQGQLDAIDSQYQALALQTDMDMLQLAHWIDKLPDSDDGELRSLKSRIDTAIAEGSNALEQARSALAAAKSDEDLDHAEALIGEAGATVDDGTSAKQAAGPLFDELKAKVDTFQQRVTDCWSISAAITQLRGRLEQGGFRMEAFDSEHAASIDAFARAQKLFDEQAVVSATRIIEEQEIKLVQLHTQLSELPKRPGRLAAEADRLRSILDEQEAAMKPAQTLADDLVGRYHQEDAGDLPAVLHNARLGLNNAGANIDKARTAASMETQDFDGSAQLLEEAEHELQQAAEQVSTVEERQRLLAELPRRLRATLNLLRTKAAETEQYVQDVQADIDDDFATRSSVLRRSVADLDAVLESNKPPLRNLKVQLDELENKLDTCLDEAQSQYQDAVRRVEEARRRAESRLSEASRYRSHSGGRFQRANDDFFTGALVGMTLQQQLHHWDQAHEAADTAYDYGRDNEPSYSSPSYSSSSDGGSSSSSWSDSSSSDSGGGSSSSDW